MAKASLTMTSTALHVYIIRSHQHKNVDPFFGVCFSVNYAQNIKATEHQIILINVQTETGCK